MPRILAYIQMLTIKLVENRFYDKSADLTYVKTNNFNKNENLNAFIIRSFVFSHIHKRNIIKSLKALIMLHFIIIPLREL